MDRDLPNFQRAVRRFQSAKEKICVFVSPDVFDGFKGFLNGIIDDSRASGLISHGFSIRLVRLRHLVRSRKELALVRDPESKHGSNVRRLEELFVALGGRMLAVYVLESSVKHGVTCREPVEIRRSVLMLDVEMA